MATETYRGSYGEKIAELEEQNAKLREAVEACLLRFRDLECQGGDAWSFIYLDRADNTAAIKYLESVLEVK